MESTSIGMVYIESIALTFQEKVERSSLIRKPEGKIQIEEYWVLGAQLCEEKKG